MKFLISDFRFLIGGRGLFLNFDFRILIFGTSSFAKATVDKQSALASFCEKLSQTRKSAMSWPVASGWGLGSGCLALGARFLRASGKRGLHRLLVDKDVLGVANAYASGASEAFLVSSVSPSFINHHSSLITTGGRS